MYLEYFLYFQFRCLLTGTIGLTRYSSLLLKRLRQIYIIIIFWYLHIKIHLQQFIRMKRLLLILLITSRFANAQAQIEQDTVFFDEKWKKTSKDSMAYFRIIKKVNKIFKVEDYHKNGKIQMTGDFISLEPELKEGKFTYYSKGNIVTKECYYKSDKLEGEYKVYYSSGKLKYLKNYTEGNLNGKVIGFYENGIIKRKENYELGSFVDGKCYSSIGTDTIYFPMEERAVFIGGQAALNKYLMEKTSYPKYAESHNIEGIVKINFVVNEMGYIQDVTVFQSVHPLLDSQSINIIRTMPRWSPAKTEGRPVKMKGSIPFNYKLK
jgi:protein TonB